MPDTSDTPGAPRTLVIGFGRVGRLVAQMLDAHRQPYLAIDADVESVRSGKHRGYSVRFGDLDREPVWRRRVEGNATHRGSNLHRLSTMSA